MTYESLEQEVFEAPTHSISTTIHIEHTQLRDLISCPTERGRLVYANAHGLATRDITRPHQPERRFAHLGFPPTCVASGSGLIAAGGQRAEIYIAPLDSIEQAPGPSSWNILQRLRGTINNSVFITNLTMGASPYEATGGWNDSTDLASPRLFVSNNDHFLRVYNIATRTEPMLFGKKRQRLSRAGSTEFKTCVNHASISPDGRTLLSVGDTDEVFLHDVRGGDTVTFEPIATYKGGLDAGFSTAWSSDGFKFAIATQDGQAIIWDSRSSTPLARFHSQESIRRRRPTQQSSQQQRYFSGVEYHPNPDLHPYVQPMMAPLAPRSPLLMYIAPGYHYYDASHIVNAGVRSIKFSPGCSGLCDSGRELLVFTEHMNNVHVVDARTFTSHTVLRVPSAVPPAPPHPEAKISSDQEHQPEASSYSPYVVEDEKLSPTSPSPTSSLSRNQPLPSPQSELTGSTTEEDGLGCTPDPAIPSLPSDSLTLIPSIHDHQHHSLPRRRSSSISRSGDVPFSRTRRQRADLVSHVDEDEDTVHDVHARNRHARLHPRSYSSGLPAVSAAAFSSPIAWSDSGSETISFSGSRSSSSSASTMVLPSPTSMSAASGPILGRDSWDTAVHNSSMNIKSPSESTHLSGLCFDSSGRYMYVGTERSIVEWDMGARRWDGDSRGIVWEGSEWA